MSEQGIPVGSPLVASISHYMEWRQLRALFWHVSSFRFRSDLWTSDAAGSISCGTYFEREWFNGTWDSSQMNETIFYKDIFPNAIAAHILGYKWSRKHVVFCSDNEAVVHILNSRISKIPSIMHLMRFLLMSAARFHFSFSTQNIPGEHNEMADALFRLYWQTFKQLEPLAALPALPLCRGPSSVLSPSLSLDPEEIHELLHPVPNTSLQRVALSRRQMNPVPICCFFLANSIRRLKNIFQRFALFISSRGCLTSW